MSQPERYDAVLMEEWEHVEVISHSLNVVRQWMEDNISGRYAFHDYIRGRASGAYVFEELNDATYFGACFGEILLSNSS